MLNFSFIIVTTTDAKNLLVKTKMSLINKIHEKGKVPKVNLNKTDYII